MSVSVAPRRDSVGSTNLPAWSSGVSLRWSRVMTKLHGRSTSSNVKSCADCEPGVTTDRYQDVTFLDTLARDKPYLYSVSAHQ